MLTNEKLHKAHEILREMEKLEKEMQNTNALKIRPLMEQYFLANRKLHALTFSLVSGEK